MNTLGSTLREITKRLEMFDEMSKKLESLLRSNRFLELKMEKIEKLIENMEKSNKKKG